MRLLLSPILVVGVKCHHSNGDLLNELWGRARSLLSGRAIRGRRRKSEPWWSGLFTTRDGEVGFSEKPAKSHDHLPRPLSVQDVLRRGAMASDGELIEPEE